jgi:hypothetical protein
MTKINTADTESASIPHGPSHEATAGREINTRSRVSARLSAAHLHIAKAMQVPGRIADTSTGNSGLFLLASQIDHIRGPPGEEECLKHFDSADLAFTTSWVSEDTMQRRRTARKRADHHFLVHC